MNLISELEATVAPKVIDQIFGAGTYDKMPAALTKIAGAQLAEDPATPEAELTAIVEKEVTGLEPVLNTEIDKIFKATAFEKNGIVAFIETEAMRAAVPLESEAIKALVPAAVAEAYKLLPAPVIDVAETVIEDVAKPSPAGGLQSGTIGGVTAAVTGGPASPLEPSGDGESADPTLAQ